MSKQLYEEALADVKKLKEVAEDNAKRALLEAVTPRIRDLIENQLLGEAADDDEKLLMDDPESEMMDLPAEPVPSIGDAALAADAISMPDEEGKVTLDLSALKTDDAEEFELSMESAQALGLLQNSKDVFESKINRLAKNVEQMSNTGKLVRESKGFTDLVDKVISEVEDMYSHLQDNFSDSSRKGVYEELLESFYSTLKQLTEQKMTKKNKTISEADEITLKLSAPGLADVDLDDVEIDLVTGAEGEEEPEGEEAEGEADELDLGDEGDEDSDELDLGDEDESEEDSDADKMESRRLRDDLVVEIDENMLRREISKMKALRESEEVQKWGHGAGDLGDLEDEDMGDPFVDVDLTTEMDSLGEYKEADGDEDEMSKHKSEMAMEMTESDPTDEAHGEDAEHTKSGEQPSDQSNEPGKTVESIRRRLDAEARLQMEAKQKAQKAKKDKMTAEQQAKQKQKEAKQKQVEAQQKAKQNQMKEAQKAKADSQKAQKEAQQKAKQAKQMKEAYNFFATKFNESVARTSKLKGMLAEAARKGSTLNGASTRSAAETNNLRTKLAETNLFNAKLLFTNKLLQNESLTKRQKAEVIERLDEARSEREVKLVYESLVKTLQGSSTNKLTESVERGVIGSSSRPTRSAASSNNLNEGIEADRWARLAGIVK